MTNGNKDSFATSDLTAALNDGDRQGLVNDLKNKLRDLDELYSEVLLSLPPGVRERVEALREIQSQHDEIEAKFFEERAALEAKYQKLYQPLYTKRYDIVNGAANEASTDQEGDKVPAVKGVPDFWFHALKNNEVLAEEITERDEEALSYLKDIKWSRIDDLKGFKLEFFFAPNPYFKDTVLTKTYHMIDEDEPILDKAIGTEIDWYPGKALTQKLLKKKSSKETKNEKTIMKSEDCESFFNFFSPPHLPNEGEDLDDDTAEELQNWMEKDYDVGSTIKDKIIPHAVSWYTGEAILGDDFFDDDDNDDTDINILDDDDEEEEDEEDETKKKSRGDGQSGERPPECKQQ